MTAKYRVERREEKPKGRCRKWLLCVRTRERYPNGRWKWSRTGFEGTYTQAMAEAERLAEAYDKGEEALPSRWTFEAYAKHWNDAKLAAGAIQESTHGKNAHLARMLSMHVGSVNVADLAPDMVESAYAKLRRGESPSGKPLSGTTIRCAATVGFSIMKHAINAGLATRNPFELAITPKADTRERRALDLGREVELALSLDPSEPHHMALLLMLEAGLRRGEACAVRWRDVHDGRLHISRSMLPDGTVKSTKNGKPRQVPIPSHLASALDARRAALEAFLARYDQSIVPDDYVLSPGFHEALTPDAMRHWWSRNRDVLGMAGWNLHELRHTYCSNLAEAGVHPKVMQQLMGHASEHVSMQVYTHVNDAQLDDAVRALDGTKRARDTKMTHGDENHG